MDKTTNAPGSCNELERVIAELAELKQRFGLDKQEAFLEAHANISLKEFADILNGRDCQPNLTPDELLLAQKRGFVVVYGDSDDRVEFDGAIRAEGHTNPFNKDIPAGVLALSEDGELLDEDSELYAEYAKENRNVINVFYCSRDGLNWAFESNIPHETFMTYDGGYDEEYDDLDDGFARCVVFELSSLKRTGKTITIAEQVINADVVRLDINGKSIRDLSPLRELSCIEYLSLEENELTNVTQLFSLTKMTKLELQKNPLKESQITELRCALPNCEILF
jgi:Leucine-rich repeat (LRR) protein